VVAHDRPLLVPPKATHVTAVAGRGLGASALSFQMDEAMSSGQRCKMSNLRKHLKPLAAVLVLVGLGASLSGCIVVMPEHPGYCYYHPYNFGC
jgi:hypothetical protein